MSKTLHISAIFAIVCLLVMRIVPYFEGVAFNKFWSIPMGVFPLGLIAFLTFIVSVIACIVAILRKKGSRKNLFVVLLFPVLVVALYEAPFPSYVDGMHHTVKNLPLGEIKTFSVEAREINPKWTNHEEHDQLIKKLSTKYPNALGLSHIPPRIEVSESHVSVFYGSALVKHWGYLVTDQESFPIEHIPEGMYKKVYEGVWVYHDIW